METLKWDEYFMTIVYVVAMKSKDERTHIGAVVVGPDKEIRSTGYNSFPRGVNDYNPERQERPYKYKWMEHGERNAINNAANVGIPLKGCVMYTHGIPCTECARSVINAGIRKIVYHEQWMAMCPKKWKDEAEISKEMFFEANVTLYPFRDLIINTVTGRIDGKDVFYTNTDQGYFLNVMPEVL